MSLSGAIIKTDILFGYMSLTSVIVFVTRIQGLQKVAKKSIKTTFPRWSLVSKVLPSRVGTFSEKGFPILSSCLIFNVIDRDYPPSPSRIPSEAIFP